MTSPANYNRYKEISRPNVNNMAMRTVTVCEENRRIQPNPILLYSTLLYSILSYRMECCSRDGMRCVLWPTNSISVNETYSNHGNLQMKKSNTVISARWEVSLCNNVLFPQLNTSLLVK